MTVPENINTNIEKTQVLYGTENSVSCGVKFMQNAKEKMDLFGDKNGPSIIIKYKEYKDNYIKARDRGAKIRFVTEITKDNIQYCKEVRKIVDEFRHFDGFRGGIAVSELEFMGTTVLKEEQRLTLVIQSKQKEVVEQQQYIFNTIWEKAIPYEQRIREIEQGIEEPEFLNTIREPREIQNLVHKIIDSSKEEIIAILTPPSSSSSFSKDIVLKINEKISSPSTKNKIKSKILVPSSSSQSSSFNKSNDNNLDIVDDDDANSSYLFNPAENIQIKYLQKKLLQPTISILVIDKKYFLVVGLNDGEGNFDDISDTIGLALYSNNSPLVLTYLAIFNALWHQVDLYNKISQIYKSLLAKDEAQQEVINIAAHELRNPLQPIIGFIKVLHSSGNPITENYNEMLNIIARNAIKLQRLSEDILDVTKLENDNFKIQKEEFDLNELILSVIHDFKHEAEKKNAKVKISNQNEKNIKSKTGSVSSSSANPVIIFADKYRICQVITNLLINAIQFTKDGEITISFWKKTDKKNTKNDTVCISVNDTGTGISADMMPKIFTAFATKSNKGTGLGLYICKKIVEAHGGTIWVENNSNEGKKGSTFTFELPLNN